MSRKRMPTPTERVCTMCKVLKPITEFYSHNQKRQGWVNYDRHCKKCDSARNTAKQKAKHDSGTCFCGRDRKPGFSKCRECYAAAAKYRAKSGDKRRAVNQEYRTRLKMQVFVKYGHACECCGEDTYEFLEIDHIGGWGTKHRDKFGRRICGQALYRWLIRQNFPKEGFRLLCGSCHGAISYHGYCPHENESDEYQEAQDFLAKMSAQEDGLSPAI